jgi:hypothetical protein
MKKMPHTRHPIITVISGSLWDPVQKQTCTSDASNSLDLTGLETLSAHICVLRSSIDLDPNSSDVGFPHSVGSSMRMAHIVSKMCTFSAN